jgi:hypothetical protein
MVLHRVRGQRVPQHVKPGAVQHQIAVPLAKSAGVKPALVT